MYVRIVFYSITFSLALIVENRYGSVDLAAFYLAPTRGAKQPSPQGSKEPPEP